MEDAVPQPGPLPPSSPCGCAFSYCVVQPGWGILRTPPLPSSPPASGIHFPSLHQLPFLELLLGFFGTTHPPHVPEPSRVSLLSTRLSSGNSGRVSPGFRRAPPGTGSQPLRPSPPRPTHGELGRPLPGLRAPLGVSPEKHRTCDPQLFPVPQQVPNGFITTSRTWLSARRFAGDVEITLSNRAEVCVVNVERKQSPVYHTPTISSRDRPAKPDRMIGSWSYGAAMNCSALPE
ncbi:hypothetical protein PGTUg99_016905 [Puccinia graminis f. sp. tritici]|uniref:Uncharacterized protein n=1 Tax=Puccinia graminis f. sp. tritici TaxID=56615 RepID=A0A5B0SIH5_PUCGR|nr:hypothetical protein PGTUg99_016905 [Puccinia graminis f. sp. tritici]